MYHQFVEMMEQKALLFGEHLAKIFKPYPKQTES